MGHKQAEDWENIGIALLEFYHHVKKPNLASLKKKDHMEPGAQQS